MNYTHLGYARVARSTAIRFIAAAFVVCTAVGIAIQPAAAQNKRRTFCIFDPVGANGAFYQAAQAYVLQAQTWGYQLKPRAYTDEQVAAKDFRAGKCDLVAITGIETLHFVKFAGSLDMAGGLQTYNQEHTAIRVMSSPKAAPYMKQNGYEVVGVMPLGKVFLFSRKKRFLESLDNGAGRKIAVLSHDKQQTALVSAAGASPVNASIATFGPMFNNGTVDLASAPAVAYQALELYKGLGEDGGIADFVLTMLSVQIVAHTGQFTSGFGQASREWVLDNLFDSALSRVKTAEHSIPDQYWVHINGQRSTEYRKMFRQVRQRLWQDNWYSHRMQHLLKKIRCNSDPGLAECSLDTEGGQVD